MLWAARRRLWLCCGGVSARTGEHAGGVGARLAGGHNIVVQAHVGQGDSGQHARAVAADSDGAAGCSARHATLTHSDVLCCGPRGAAGDWCPTTNAVAPAHGLLSPPHGGMSVAHRATRAACAGAAEQHELHTYPNARSRFPYRKLQSASRWSHMHISVVSFKPDWRYVALSRHIHCVWAHRRALPVGRRYRLTTHASTREW